MIGDLLSTLSKAQKLDIASIQLGVQNGTIPPYIGVPLLQEKIQQRKQAEAILAGQQQANQPPVAQQVMQSADQIVRPQEMPAPMQAPMQAEQPGIDAVQSNLPQNFADGGIVAFADGGLPDDKEEDDELEELFPTSQVSEFDMLQLLAARRARDEEGKGGIASIPSAGGEYKGGPVAKGEIKEIIANAAKKYGVPYEVMERIAGGESGFNPRAQNKSESAAKGLFQFLDPTWKSMGGKPGMQFDPTENAEVAARFQRKNAEQLRNSLGRNPTYAELGLAHFMGAGGASSLLKTERDLPIEEGLARFSKPAMVERIMRENPQLKGKSVGDVIARQERKMGRGTFELAEGGIVALANGGLGADDENYDDYEYTLEEKPKTYAERLAELTKPEFKLAPFKATTSPGASMFGGRQAATPPVKPKLPPTIQSTPSADELAMLRNPKLDEAPPAAAAPKPQPEPTTTTTTGSTTTGGTKETAPVSSGIATDPYVEKFRERLASQMEEAKNERDINKWLALAQTGFGMMAGTSPHAAANIGAAASQGLGTYAALQQAAKKDVRDLQAQELALYKYEQAAQNAAENRKLMDWYRRESLGQSKAQFGETLKEKQAERDERTLGRYRDDYQQLLTSRLSQLQKEFVDKNPMYHLNPEMKKQYEARKLQIENSPEIIALRRRAYPDLFKDESTGSGGAKGRTIDFTSIK